MSDGVQDLLGDRAFGMDPHATLLTLARQFVAGQRMLAAMQRGAQTARAASPDAPEAVALCEEFERVETAWYTKGLPNLAACMRLAIEVFDTFGPGWRAWTTRPRPRFGRTRFLCGLTNSAWLQRNRGHEPLAWLCCSTCGCDHGGSSRAG
jgi:hypothetical protein